MPRRWRADDEYQIIHDLVDAQRGHGVAIAASQLPTWAHDIFTAPATYQLSALPYGINALADNGLVLSEGTDYTVDYTTGLITFTVARTAGHVIFVSYVTTGDLTSASAIADVGSSGNAANWIISSNRARLTTGTLSGHATGGHYAAYIPVGGYANDVQCVVAVGSSGVGETGHLYVALADHGSGSIDFVSLDFTSNGDTLGYSYGSVAGGAGGSGVLGGSITPPWTLRATLSSAGLLSAYQNGTLVGTLNVATANPTAWTAISANCNAIGIGVGDSGNSLTASVFESFQTTSGSIVDSFNRANQTGLGNADTGQAWSYTP